MLCSDEIHVWWVGTDSQPGQGEQFDWVLSTRERSRCTRLAPRTDRRDYAAAHALLRTTLSMYGSLAPDAWTFEENVHGKPYLVRAGDEHPLEFNLSHAPGLVACAVSGGMHVGIDVECLDGLIGYPYLYDRWLSADERAALWRCPPDARRTRFAELWTLKEALLKTVGIGLAGEPSQLSFDFSRHGTILPNLPDEFPQGPFDFALFKPTTRHRLAVAIERAGAATIRICARAADDGHEIAAIRTTIFAVGPSRPPTDPPV